MLHHTIPAGSAVGMWITAVPSSARSFPPLMSQFVVRISVTNPQVFDFAPFYFSSSNQNSPGIGDNSVICNFLRTSSCVAKLTEAVAVAAADSIGAVVTVFSFLRRAKSKVTKRDVKFAAAVAAAAGTAGYLSPDMTTLVTNLLTLFVGV